MITRTTSCNPTDAITLVELELTTGKKVLLTSNETIRVKKEKSAILGSKDNTAVVLVGTAS